MSWHTKLGEKLGQLYDRHVSRWTHVYINAAVAGMFAGGAFFLEGWVRDFWWFIAGLNAGYTFMWLTFPRFSAARKREMEAEMNLLMASSLNRMTKEALSVMVRVAEEEADSEQPRRLQ